MSRSPGFWKAALLPGGLGLFLGATLYAQGPAVPPPPARMLPPPGPPMFLVGQPPVQPPPVQPPPESKASPDLPRPQEAAPTAPPQVAAPEPAQAPAATGTGAGAGAAPAAATAMASTQAPSFGAAEATTAAAASDSPTQAFAAQQATTGVATGGEAQVRETSDVGDLLSKSLGSVGVQVQRRSPIITDPRVRGFRQGQILTLADGALALPVRPDLDTIVSKIDSTLISSAVVVKGPFSVRSGPAFSIIDVETVPTPRYEKGFEYHGSTFLSARSNSPGMTGLQSVWGGDADYGFRITWDAQTGADYRTGAGFKLPTSYNSQNFSFAFGFDLDEDNRVEFKALRLMQRDVEVPGAITDINRLFTDSFTLRFSSQEQALYDGLVVDLWFNETRFNGDNLRPGKRRQIPQLDNLPVQIEGGPIVPFRLFTETDGDANSWGGRSATTWGKEKESQLTAGVDFRYLSQAVNEFDSLFATGAQGGEPQNFPIPRSRSVNPGLFADLVLPMNDRWTLRAGARGDLVAAKIQEPVPQPLVTAERLALDLGPGALDTQHYALWSAFLVSETRFSEQILGSVSYGYAQRAPTLVELFADRPFLSLLQNGFAAFQGNPNLEKEQAHQLNVGAKGEFADVRLSVNGFCTWVPDYITFEQLANLPGTELTSFRFVNTRQALLAGADGYLEVDLVEWLTPFATLSYVRGEDLTRGAPLPSIPPLDGRVGVRIHDPAKRPRWAVEYLARMVATQAHPATYLLEQRTPGFTIHDLRGYWQVNEHLLLTGGIENLGDRLFREHLDIRTGRGVFQPGINVYAGIRLTY